ncbi:putative glucosidase 2 subunit beta protein [Botrytis fragariae]|uniref:Glucosidase 2 subunit beta n=1 Tax=Botrytis fragariae TaxID=1964551 RepID=A0A8H6B2D0_9HELO|nr:putative glucosidase 2 subunit beta protein [Botrytis fragariae]KAF5877850.1 putative glucosidase 2 subunit beta protein [Botrytis fragariae]
MVAAKALVLLSTISTSVLAAEATRPRGVGPEFAKFYKSTDKFTCLSNPSISIDISKVNDDYCDCPDGSDEPGTSACTYLSNLSPPQPLQGTTGSSPHNTSLALPGYYCKNKGHIPTYVPFTYVNDGVCDYELCCDGSDEWENVGGTKCADKCAEIGKEWRRLDDIRTKAQVKANKKRDELVNEAQRLRADVQMSIGRTELEISQLEKKEEELKQKYEEVERKERGKVVKTSEGKTSKVSILALMAKTRVAELRDALTGVQAKKVALQNKVNELEGILARFKEERNPNFNDEGVKRAVKAWEDYAATKDASEAEDTESQDAAVDETAKAENDGIEWETWENDEEESDVDALYKFEEYLPESIRTWVHQKVTDLHIILIENGVLADNANSGSESKSVQDARNAYQAVSDDVGAKQNTLSDLKSDLEKDYGVDDIFRALKGSCVSKDSGEYDYELCWMEKTSQKSKKGGGNTGMGNFVRFDKIEVDEEVDAGGKGLGKGVRTTLVYENGQHCWNGPNRATTVVLACAEKDEIWKVVEMEKCNYRMDVGTPAVCERVVKGGPKKDAKDEL